MQQADGRIGALDHLAVHLQHQAQDAVRGRVLRAEVEGQRLDLDFGHQVLHSPALVVRGAFSSPGRWSMPSQGLMSSEARRVRKECVSTFRSRWSPYP